MATTDVEKKVGDVEARAAPAPEEGSAPPQVPQSPSFPEGGLRAWLTVFGG